jgi:hypothetical protein
MTLKKILLLSLISFQYIGMASSAQNDSEQIGLEIQRIQKIALDQKLSFWPGYINETVQNCKLLSSDSESLNKCLQKLVTTSEKVLTCENNIEYWREISRTTPEDNELKKILKPKEKVPLYIQDIFTDLTQATDKMLREGKKIGAIFPVSKFDPINWSIDGYLSDEFNASSISNGHVEISSAFWSPASTFEPSDVRAILAHEISHVLFNHPLKITCLAFEWQQGSGDLKEALQYFFDPNPGPRYEALSEVSNKIEYSADEFALTVLRNANHNPKDMIRALEKIEKFPLKGQTINDHPQMKLRIDRLKLMKF